MAVVLGVGAPRPAQRDKGRDGRLEWALRKGPRAVPGRGGGGGGDKTDKSWPPRNLHITWWGAACGWPAS